MIFTIISLYIIIAIPICIGLFVYHDAKSRGMEAILWTLAAVLIPYCIGLIIYLVVRYNHSANRCYRCGANVKDTYTLCPQCGVELKAKCPSCNAYIEPDWRLCAHCGTELPYMEPYYDAPKSSGFNTKILVKGLIISGIITLSLILLFVVTAGFFISIPFQISGSSIMHHI